MKTLDSKINVKRILSSILNIALVAVFVWWGMHLPGLIPPSAKADDPPFPVTCTPTPPPPQLSDPVELPNPTCAPTPYPYPASVETLPFESAPYRNPNGAKLGWVVYDTNPNVKKPGVLIIHGTNWNAGNPQQVYGELREIGKAGFFAAAVSYELAPNGFDVRAGYIPGQPCHDTYDVDQSGFRMGQQIDDIKDYVKAMRADSRCRSDGWVAVVGGSAGASHAITVALDTNKSGGTGNIWPFWFQGNHDDRPNCAVMLSAIYNFADWIAPNGSDTGDTDPYFVHFGLRNYCQDTDLSWTTARDLPLNPVNLVDGAITKGWKPIYMFNTFYDHPTAYHQLVGFICLLQQKGLQLGTDYKYVTLNSGLHSFHYWGSQIPNSDNTVGDEVITFLKAQAGLP